METQAHVRWEGVVLVRQFAKAVSWWFDLDRHYESGRAMRTKLDGFLHRAFGGEQQDAAANQRMRQQLIHDQASRAVEWNWEQPDKIYDFIRSETPKCGYLWEVTPEDIFQYSQQHYAELLPKRSDPQSQARLDDLRANLRADQPSPHFN